MQVYEAGRREETGRAEEGGLRGDLGIWDGKLLHVPVFLLLEAPMSCTHALCQRALLHSSALHWEAGVRGQELGMHPNLSLSFAGKLL